MIHCLREQQGLWLKRTVEEPTYSIAGERPKLYWRGNSIVCSHKQDGKVDRKVFFSHFMTVFCYSHPCPGCPQESKNKSYNGRLLFHLIFSTNYYSSCSIPPVGQGHSFSHPNEPTRYHIDSHTTCPKVIYTSCFKKED